MIRYGLLKNNLRKVKSAMSLFLIQECQSLCPCDVVNSRVLLQLVTIEGLSDKRNCVFDLVRHIQVTSAAPSSGSNPPSSRWESALRYPPPNTGKPPIPPEHGDDSSVCASSTPRLTEWLDISRRVDPWRNKNKGFKKHFVNWKSWNKIK